jgi:uncharacterized membrane protein
MARNEPVPSAPAARSVAQDDSPLWLWGVAVAALLAGLYGRFKGLGAAPLGVDEFYVSRSVDNILRTGLPEFLCGGYYNRGPLYQYLAGAMRVLGWSTEAAPRLVSALFSVAALPAVYLLGRRVHGKTVGLLAVIVLCLSVWEIEMARFARMYAPFQAVFVWYLLFFLNYMRDSDRRSLVAMIALSLFGVLIWEGGALLGIVNLLPPLLRHREGRLRREDYLYIGSMLGLFVVLYVLAVLDLRTYADTPAYADWYRLAPTDPGTDAMRALGIQLPSSTFWIAMAALPVAAWLASLRWIWSLRSRWLAACGLLVAATAALAHQLLIAVALLALLLLAGLIHWRELIERPARLYLASLALAALYWLSVGFGTDAWIAGESPPSLAGLAQIVALKLFGFPNVIDEIVRPWGRTMPLWSVCLFGALAGLMFVAIRRATSARTAVAILLIVAVVMILAVGASGTGRQETRYTFFLYPVLVLLAIAALAQLLGKLSANARIATGLLSAITLSCFAASGDFRPRHVAAIDSDAVIYRVTLPAALVSHYYPHNDVRGAAAWLKTNASVDDRVLTGIPSLAQYSDRIDFAFLIDDDPRYEAFSCQAGTLDRWTHKPLLYSAKALDELLHEHRAYLVTYPSQTPPILDEAQNHGWQAERVWTSIDGGVNILLLSRATTASPRAVSSDSSKAQR